MAIPEPPPLVGARSLLRNALAQNDVDMNFHKLLNLDWSNLPFPPPPGSTLPPTIVPRPKFWIDGWDRDTQAWHIDQPSFDDLRPPLFDVNLGRQRIFNLDDPIQDRDAVNLRTVSGMIQSAGNLNVHEPVVAATTGNILHLGLHPVDGYDVQAGDRVLVKNQAVGRGLGNGIYIASTGDWAFAEDWQTDAQKVKAYVFVKNGDTQANTAWVQIANPPFTNDNPPHFVLFSRGGGVGDLIAGDGIDITGNTVSALGTPNRVTVNPTGIDIAANYAGQNSITHLGTVNVGTWQAATILPEWGGTGVNNGQNTLSLFAGNVSVELHAGAPPASPLVIDLKGPTTITFPTEGELAVYPDQTGHDGDVLTTDGTDVAWVKPVPLVTFINVKDPPYNAVGDGTTDDFIAVQRAVSDAAGQTVYFPRGTYYLSQNLAPIIACSLLGDTAVGSVLRGNPNLAGAFITLQSGSQVARLGFDGGLLRATTQPVAVTAGAVEIRGAQDVSLRDCAVRNCPGYGIFVNGSTGTQVTDCRVDNCGLDAIHVENSPKSWVTRNRISHATGYGVLLLNSPQSFVHTNAVHSCGLQVYGVAAFDSDNTPIYGNVVQQCALGLLIATSANRGMQSYGMNANGNVITRNYFAGARIQLSHGFQFTGNTLADNGQGGVDNNTYTLEPGFCIDPANAGSGYQVGDILTLIGGAGSVARVLVTKILLPGGSIAPDGIHAINPGKYTAFPPNPVATSGGNGTGARVIMTGTIISNPGQGYVSGQILRGVTGPFINPMRIEVTAVNSSGGVTAYEVLDGGGYFGASLPMQITFASDSAGQGGSGLAMIPGFGNRYSARFQGMVPFNLSTLGQIMGGVVSGNTLSSVRSGGYGMLVQEAASPYNFRAQYMTVVGNSLINNAGGAFAGQTLGNPIDANYNFNSIFDNNMTFP